MRQRRQRGDDVEGRAVLRAHFLAAGGQAKCDHLRNRAARRRGLAGRGKPGLDEAQERLGEERVVIGRAVADLHRLPHRLGDAFPGRIDQVARRRAGDEDPRQIEQQRRILVAARIQPGQRHQQFAAAQIGIAEQIEGGVGRDEAASAERTQQMRPAGPDHRLDLGKGGRAAGHGKRLRPGMAELDRVQKRRHRRPDGGPVRRRLVARGSERGAQGSQPALVAEFGKPGPAQQRAQRGIAERGPIELSEMRVAAGIFAQQGIADVVQRRAVFPGRQGATGGTGEIAKMHENFSPRPGAAPAETRRHPLPDTPKTS